MFPGTIEIKNSEVLRGLFEHKVDSTLSEVLLYITENWGLVITETWRPAKHSNDLHALDPLRAIDLRAWCYNGGLNRAKIIANCINELWIYDPNRPNMVVALLHDAGKGIHFHIQVHPLTKRR